MEKLPPFSGVLLRNVLFCGIVFALAVATVAFAEDSPEFGEPVEAALFDPANHGDPHRIFPHFHPIGWSKDGKFAYVDTVSGGGRCEVLVRLNIVDLVTDECLECLEAEADNEASISPLWQDQYPDVKARLQRYRIIQEDRCLIFAFPSTFSGDTISCRLEQYETGQDMWTFPMGPLSLWIDSQKRGSKKIYENANTYVNAEVLGCLRSPFENRIAVLWAQTFPGWEGPPNAVQLNLNGCHLTAGTWARD
jgi:hypothetical protein